MSHIKYIATRTLSRVFENISRFVGCEIDDVQLVISYPGGIPRYDIYRDFKEFKTGIKIESYIGMAVDFGGTTMLLEATLNTAGSKYASECKCSADVIQVVLKHRAGDLPLGVLLANGVKVRDIDVAGEYFMSAAA